ncbi:hypothetical protein [Shewanella salipaludis]|uniref:Lipoprotein n=1 Tax=Shewanella salipaludis TaxID=2723052 RepID=A0A972JL13_9GAMM|nr:hypothetical protein [Shewanella salipaludis]NMH64942.1 hypothetical protein [Shewanella salipaludis]
MKKLILCTLVLSISACKSTDIRTIADSVSDIAGIAESGSTGGGSVPGYQHPSQQYSTSSTPFYITDNTKMNPELGAIRSITQEKNPKGMTMVRVVAYHQDSGAAMDSKSYFYAVDANGWLKEDAVTSFYPKAININSGVYYLKAEARDGGDFYTSGMVTLARGVTNVVTIELQ